MTKRQQIDARVEAQLTGLRAALDVQFKRIAQMQAELDGLPQARQRRKTLRELLTPASYNGEWPRRAASETEASPLRTKLEHQHEVAYLSRLPTTHNRRPCSSRSRTCRTRHPIAA